MNPLSAGQRDLVIPADRAHLPGILAWPAHPSGHGTPDTYPFGV